MLKITCRETDIEALRYWRFHHPDPRIQVRMEAIYLRSQRVANRDIPRLCGMSQASFHRYRHAYVTGIARQPTQVRQFLNVLGMRPRRVGVLPAKAGVAAQEAFK